MKQRNLIYGLISGLLLFVLIAAVMSQEANGFIEVRGAWARPGDSTSAVYLSIHNAGDQVDQLVAAESPAGIAEIHETRIENDVMRMRPAGALDIAPGETLTLEPGGLHIMIMNLQESLQSGNVLPLRLIFASGASIDIEAFISEMPVARTLDPDALTERSQMAVAQGTYVGQVVDPPVQVLDFSAPASNPALTKLSDTGGTWRVIFFGYMHCPDFCPLTLVDYKHANALLGDTAEQVTFMLISVDSVRDTPEAMQRYLANFDPSFVGFSPDDATLAHMQPDYGFYYERRMESGSQAIYAVDHSTRSYLLDPEGVLRASFAYDVEPQALADALRWYMEHN